MLSRAVAIVAWICLPVYLLQTFVHDLLLMHGLFGRNPYLLPWWKITLKTFGLFLLLTFIIPSFREDILSFFDKQYKSSNDWLNKWLFLFIAFLLVSSFLVSYQSASYK
jgi:hypothetical protein